MDEQFGPLIATRAIASSGRSAPRSKNGCSTCRIRKIKCDEQRPMCLKCTSARIKCEWNRDIPNRRSVANHKAKRNTTASILPRSDLSSTVSSSSTPQNEVFSAAESDLDQQTQHLVRYDDHARIVELSPTSSSSVTELSSPTLTTEDLAAFHHIPESLMVVRFGKPWKWSMLSYVHSRIAPHDAGVTSAFIAVASMELRAKHIGRTSDNIASPDEFRQAVVLRDSAANHFHVAINRLCSLLDTISISHPRSEELDSLFALWFLILHCELYDPDLVRASQIHLNGIRLFLARYLWEDKSGKRELPPASQQLLLFITYLDINLALGNLNGGQLCLDLMSIPKESPLAYDRIWEASRTCLPKMWGLEYPLEEILDDIENYRGLHFLHCCQKLKINLWQTIIALGKDEDINERKCQLLDQIKSIGKEFTDVLTLANVVEKSDGRRVIWTIYHACLDYHAAKVMYSCIGEDDMPVSWSDEALQDLLAIAHKSFGEDTRQLYRTSWPLAVALLKVKDPIHRDWIEEQLRRAKVLLAEVGIPSRILEGPASPQHMMLEFRQIDTNNGAG